MMSFLQASRGSLSFGLKIFYKLPQPTCLLGGFLPDKILMLRFESSSKLQSSKSVSDFSPFAFFTSCLYLYIIALKSISFCEPHYLFRSFWVIYFHRFNPPFGLCWLVTILSGLVSCCQPPDPNLIVFWDLNGGFRFGVCGSLSLSYLSTYPKSSEEPASDLSIMNPALFFLPESPVAARDGSWRGRGCFCGLEGFNASGGFYFVCRVEYFPIFSYSSESATP